MRSLLIAFFVLGAAACGNEASTGPAGLGNETVVKGNITATRIVGGIRLVNETGEPLAYIATNRQWLGLVARCIDPGPGCIRLGARASLTIADVDIIGYAPGMREATVVVWRVLPDAEGGYRAEDITEFVIVM